MHDAKGRELKVGDVVIVPFVVTRLHGGEHYCNVSLITATTMPPEHSYKPELHSINTKQMLRANEGDPEGCFNLLEDGAKSKLRGKA